MNFQNSPCFGITEIDICIRILFKKYQKLIIFTEISNGTCTFVSTDNIFAYIIKIVLSVITERLNFQQFHEKPYVVLNESVLK